MFDFVHEKRRVVQIVLLLIILPFAFFGLDSYRHASDTDAPASVNGTNITKQEFDNALRQQQDKMRQMMGANFDPALFDKRDVKMAILDNLIAQRLLIDRAHVAGLIVTDDQVAQVIAGIDAFKAEGRFDKARYASALAVQNMTPAIFESRVKDELTGQQLHEAYTQNGYTANLAAENIIAINEQQRIVSVAQLSLPSFIAQAKVDNAAVKTYFEQHQKDFQLPEQAKVEYVTLSINDLMASVDIKKEDVRKFYDEHLSEFATPEQRHAAHILLLVDAKAPKAEQDAVKVHAESLLAQLKLNPAKFADLAKQNSQDPGSAANGGDLGLFARGMMVKPFEDAVFALKPGELSALVKSDFGYHIIKLVDIKSSAATPFDAVRDAIVTKLRQQKAADQFAELADKFSNVVYEQSDTLKPAAQLAGLKISQSDWLTKGLPADGIWNAKMLQAVFSDDAIKNHRNTAAVEVAASTLVAARLIEHKPASIRAFEEVQELIRQKILHKIALDMAEKQGIILLGQLKQGSKPQLDWQSAQTITHAQHGSLDTTIVRQLFQADLAKLAKLPQYVGAASENGFMIVRLDSVKNSDKPDELKLARYAQQLRQMTGDELFQAYIADAKLNAKIKVKLPEVVTEKP